MPNSLLGLRFVPTQRALLDGLMTLAPLTFALGLVDLAAARPGMHPTRCSGPPRPDDSTPTPQEEPDA